MKYLDIVIDNKARATDTFYTYATEDESIKVGQKVYVQFARGKALREGYVFAVNDSYNGEYKIKYIDHIDEDICLSEEMIRTCIWMKQRYLVKYIDGIGCFTPPVQAPKGKIKEKKPVEISEDKKNLTAEQKAALDSLSVNIENGKHDIFLVHGVTSSGKTEVYMQAIEKTIAAGKTSIMMVPEVALTKEILSRFERRFGSDALAIMHYKLTKGQRYEQWQKIRSGQVKIVIGARSAVFAPLENIGLVILDEEHESTYKSDMTPKYETVEVAIKRAKEYGGIVVLGSATPSVVSTYRADQGIYKKIELKKRFNENLLPEVEVVDMGKERHEGNMSVFSRKLYTLMKENLAEGRQVLLFHNRRGFSTYITCADCGHVLKCPDCGISLTYHRDINGVKCHYCGHSWPAKDKCPECGGKLLLKGSGTQKLEDEVARLFPDNTFDRLDFDVASKAGGSEKVLNAFRKKKTDILIGTQMIAKGLDFDNVGLVGVMSADHELNIPDYRSPERTYQLITQAAGRAGRGDFRGKVVIQGYDIENYAVQYAASNDYEGFCREELKIRNMMDYPPYTDLIKILFTAENEREARRISERCFDFLSESLGRIKMFRPAPAPMNRIKETYRYQILIKCPKGMRLKYLDAAGRFIETCDNSKVNIVVDVNPYSFT